MEFNAVIHTYLPASLQARDINFVGVHLGGVAVSIEYACTCARVWACVCAFVG